MNTPQLRGWQERLVIDIVAPGLDCEGDAEVLVYLSSVRLREVDAELARRERAARRAVDVRSPFDARYDALMTLSRELKERVDVVAYLAASGHKLRRVGRDGRGRTEHAGPCPLCGGRDRFRAWGQPQSRYWCRQCDARGDVIQLVQQVDGIDFAGAVRVLAAIAGVVR